MKFSIIASALIAVAAAQYGEESCSAVVTVTITETLKHTPLAPSSLPATGPAPYPTTYAPAPPVGTGYSSKVPLDLTKTSVGTAAPSGTGAYSAPPSQFTGAASSLKVGGALAAGAVAALFL
ncbi:hypothetical protein EK21DRAFT_83933 [Setomelanomma holmii]|uniref:Uncharacterized protein n=1 Tax=Setomelanomma holmii TaxID=210430 RepID=A0A9P4HNK0_9PLEO|nr:hypothetical protein EK21DRAFT_83933 [Setomelanomma holmii]